jgi:hypothetical protein
MIRRESLRLLPLAVMSIATPVLAQSNVNLTPPPQQPDSTFDFAVNAGYEHRFESELDDNGELSVDRLIFGIAVETDISRELTATFGASYGFDSYNFSNAALGDSSDPWSDIHAVNLNARFAWKASPSWTIYLRPAVQWDRESGADWGDSSIFGGGAAAAYHASESLTIGGGVGVITQLEDDVRIFPIFIISWQFANDFRLSTLSAEDARGRGGIELVWTPPTSDWEFAVGGAYEFRRFRLDDEGVAPNGIGEETATPFWLRATYKMNDNFALNVIGGMAFGTSLELEDSDGDTIDETDADAAPILGISGTVRF